MKPIANSVDLKTAIRVLEIRQAYESRLLKIQFKKIYENLTPSNLIKSTLSEINEDADFKTDIINTSLGITAGYLSKKAVVGNSKSPFKNLLGQMVQVGVTSIVSKNADGIKTFVNFLSNSLFNKKEKPD